MEREVYDKELAYTTGEAEKSRDLKRASWRPRRADSVSPSPNTGRLQPLEELTFDQVKGGKRPMFQLKELGRKRFLLPTGG